MNWTQWVRRIFEQLGLPTGCHLTDVSLPRPFLLAPQRNEISSEEADALFSAVRERLIAGLTPPITAGPIRDRLRRLSPEESLPILYAMRLVARNWGRPHRYWPEFHERVLARQVELSTVQVGLAAELRNVWLRFYQATERVLYYPREGRVNIKWPIAHAGLLAEDIEALRSYGMALSNEWDANAGELPSLLIGEIDDFLLDLLDWLDTSSYAYSRLHEMLDPNQAVSFSVAELARRWLGDHFYELQAPQIGGETVLRRRPQVRIRYDPNRGELEAVLGETVWPGHIANVSVEFGEMREKLQTLHDPTTNLTRTVPFSLVLKTSIWPTTLTIRAGDTQKAISMVPSPFSDGLHRGALLFRADTGHRTRQWAVGEQYYLVAPIEMAQQAWMKSIFSNPIPLGPPAGTWAGYETLLVTARDPLENISPDDQDAKLEEINDQLAQASVGLSLPGLNDLYSPRARAVAGRRIPIPGSLDSFAISSLPFFEICGRWKTPLQAQLKLWQNSEYRQLEQIVLEPNQNGLPVLLAPNWALIRPERGTCYRLLLGQDTPYDFRCASEPEMAPHVLHVDLRFVVEDQDVDGNVSLGRYLLDQGIFKVSAWPEAPLVIRVESAGRKNWCACYADKDGNLLFQLNDLGIQLPPSGGAKVWVEYGAVSSQALNFFDSPYVVDWAAEWQPDGRLWVYGQIKGIEVNSSVYVVVFGLLPWKGQIWDVESKTSPLGEFEATLSANNEFARWIAFLPATRGLASSLEPAWVVKTLQGAPVMRLITGNDLRGDWGQWIHWASSLVKVPHPPDINYLVQLLPLGRLLSSNTPIPCSCWRPLSPILVEQVDSLISAGWGPKILLSIEEAEYQGGDPIVLGKAEVQNPEAVLRAFGRQESMLVSLNWDGESIKALLFPLGEGKLRLSFENQALFCLECKRPHPPHHYEACKRFMAITSGSQTEATPLLFWNSLDVLSGLIRLMKQADAEEGEALITGVVRPWADRLLETWSDSTEQMSPFEWLDQLEKIAGQCLQLELNQSHQYTLQDLQELATAIRSHDGALVFVNWVREWSR